jgi:lipoyl-dependent peroxiredoxin
VIDPERERGGINGDAKWKREVDRRSQNRIGSPHRRENAWTGEYSWTRFAGVLAPENEGATDTNPEELLAAAHAACFSMALSLGLTESGHPTSSIDTTARVHLLVVDGAPTIEQIDLETRGAVPGLDQKTFREHANRRRRAASSVARSPAWNRSTSPPRSLRD